MALLINQPREMMQQEYEIIGNQNPDDLELAEVTNSQLGRWMNEAMNRESPSLFPNWVEESQAPLVASWKKPK